MSRVAIIGGGPCAMSAMVAFSKAELEGEAIPEIVCFEKQAKLGGQWNFTWHSGVDEHGVPISNSMYEGLFSNSPKELKEFYDYTFDEHFGKAIPSYIRRESVLEYLMGRAAKYNIDRFVKSSTLVRDVKSLNKDQFKVNYEDLVTNEINEEIFDYIIVASGRFTTPNIPQLPGIETFPGRVFHSHELRRMDELRSGDNLPILLIGSGLSGIDIALSQHKYIGGKTLLSNRGSIKIPINYPNTVQPVSELINISGRQCTFKDGSKHEVSQIIFCTGYQFRYPFLEQSLRFNGPPNTFFPDNLYKCVLLPHNPRVGYMGMQAIFSFPMYDCQAWFLKEHILGKLKLPGVQEIKNDIDVWQQHLVEVNKKEGLIGRIKFLVDYMKDII
eukprot:TCONS_00054452-protein